MNDSPLPKYVYMQAGDPPYWVVQNSAGEFAAFDCGFHGPRGYVSLIFTRTWDTESEAGTYVECDAKRAPGALLWAPLNLPPAPPPPHSDGQL